MLWLIAILKLLQVVELLLALCMITVGCCIRRLDGPMVYTFFFFGLWTELPFVVSVPVCLAPVYTAVSKHSVGSEHTIERLALVMFRCTLQYSASSMSVIMLRAIYHVHEPCKHCLQGDLSQRSQ